MAEPQPSIFVSYAHEDADLARAFATALEATGARVWLDQGELLIGDSLIERISEAIAEFDFVAALVSDASAQSNWCRKEIALAMTKQLRRGGRRVTVLPVRVGDVAMPASLTDVKWVQLDPRTIEDCAHQVVRDAARHLALRTSPAKANAENRGPHIRDASLDPDEPIRIVGVDTDRVTQPRGDGTRGSALYRIPFRLNRAPHAFWAAHFAEVWNSPPAFTSMHRPGIASVQGDRIILDGTTIDEVEQYHLKTLKLAVKRLNELTEQQLAAERTRREANERADAEHARTVRDVASRLQYDDD